MSSRRSVTISRRLRPIRLAFLVKPGDHARLRRVLQVNTLIWGGSFNGIIPVYRRLPSLLKEYPLRNASEFVAGYIEAFDPDFLVVTEPSLAEGIDFPSRRIISLTDVLDPEAEDHIGHGLSVIYPYRHLYDREFKFQRRDPVEVLLPQLQETELALLSAAIYGEFPRESALDYFRQAYVELFDPIVCDVRPDNYFASLGPEVLNPLRAAQEALDTYPWAQTLHDTVLFLLDGSSFLDVVDFWNLRALGWNALAVPRQWAAELADACGEFAAANHWVSPRNPAFDRRTLIVGSRSVAEDEVEEFTRSVRGAGRGVVIYQGRFPRLWYGWGRRADRAERCWVSAGVERSEVEVIDDTVSFKVVAPVFARHFFGRGPRWVNVVEFRDYWGRGETASALPPQLDDLRRIVDLVTLDEVWVSSEGITLTCRESAASDRWRLPSGLEVMRAWMAQAGFDVRISGSGRVAQEIMRRLGRYGIALLANRELLDQLNRMAHGEVEMELEASEPIGKRRAMPRSVPRGVILELLRSSLRSNIARGAEVALRRLVDSQVLRLGLRISCPYCDQRNWYPVGGIREELSCERCLRVFPFPSANPPRYADWHYRVIGPFATENYAQGSYTVLLAYRALTRGSLGDQATWVPSFTARGNGLELEADFALWWRPSAIGGPASQLVFGECKSFQTRFTRADVERMAKLGRAFPGSLLAFCTLRDELDGEERRAIARLALEGRRSIGPGQSRNPVIVLTGIELFGDSIPYCWQERGIAQALLSTATLTGDLRKIADLTQQIHLGLESYDAWLWNEMRRRMKRDDSQPGMKPAETPGAEADA